MPHIERVIPVLTVQSIRLRRYKDTNVKIILEPLNMPWAYEMKIEDPDGNVLWLGTEPRVV